MPGGLAHALTPVEVSALEAWADYAVAGDAVLPLLAGPVSATRAHAAHVARTEPAVKPRVLPPLTTVVDIARSCVIRRCGIGQGRSIHATPHHRHQHHQLSHAAKGAAALTCTQEERRE